MRWLDVCGPPGSGKSTLCDPIWGPHDVAFDDSLPPAEWHDYLNEVSRLLHLLKDCPTFVAALRMNRRSARKMNAVRMLEGQKPYIQTGFVQRGLGFGWRMVEMGIDLNELRPFFQRMPVSLGVAVCRIDAETVKQRNKDREKVRETAHENRSHMVDYMQPAIELAIEELKTRGIAVLEIDTSKPVDTSRAEIVKFADKQSRNAKANGSGCQIPVLSPPLWW